MTDSTVIRKFYVNFNKSKLSLIFKSIIKDYINK